MGVRGLEGGYGQGVTKCPYTCTHVTHYTLHMHKMFLQKATGGAQHPHHLPAGSIINSGPSAPALARPDNALLLFLQSMSVMCLFWSV